ncbi:hypothetical protein ACM9HF_02760 [Colwellia sp. RE-S-Sl-9]
MVRIFLFFFIVTSFFIKAGNPRWDDSIDINNPDLTVNVVAQQCHKSLINAPDELEQWCNKAINMGYWNALVPLSLHSGNGSRLVQEATKRVNAKEPNAYATLAWLYETGMFVKQDINYAIALHEEFLVLDTKLLESQVTSAHEELAKLFAVKKNWQAVSRHAQYVIINSKLAFNRENATRLMKMAQEELALENNKSNSIN